MHFTTIILAGGRSFRMGSCKALMPYSGKPLIQYSIDLALRFAGDILISANSGEFDAFGFTVIPDILNVKAPIAGVHAGLKHSQTDWNLVLTCDMPNLSGDIITRLLQKLDSGLQMVVPFHNGFAEPLCGFYHRELISLIEQNNVAGKLSMLDLPGTAPHRFITMNDLAPDEIARVFKNVNEKKDLKV
jgi:molybdopterin-guanine dinucleotide biosynthesis protein A